MRVRLWLASLFAPAEDKPDTDEQVSGVDIGSFGPDDLEAVESLNQAVEVKLRSDYQRNLREPVRLKSLQLASVEFFSDTEWEFRPSVNVLLGRNGYGKSLLLRSLVGMLQRREGIVGILLDNSDPKDGRIELRAARNGVEERLERRNVWRDSLGRVPVLAIPDSRFTDRRSTTVFAPDTIDLASDGAMHFLDQVPYQSVVEGLLHGLCLDYYEHGRSFELPNFELLRSVVRRLTDETFDFQSIERVGRTGFEMWVLTEGADTPLRIQQASQGTLSVLTIFGLIHAFLDALSEASNPGGYDAAESSIGRRS